MLCPPAVNDNGSAGCLPTAVRLVRASDVLGAKVKRLQTEAERAGLDALAFILAMAAREASRIAGWERRVFAELSSGLGSVRLPDSIVTSRRAGEREGDGCESPDEEPARPAPSPSLSDRDHRPSQLGCVRTHLWCVES